MESCSGHSVCVCSFAQVYVCEMHPCAAVVVDYFTLIEVCHNLFLYSAAGHLGLFQFLVFFFF